MGNREECPVCKGYGSDLYTAFKNEEDCPRCGTSYDSILSFYEIELKKKHYQALKISVEIIAENESLKKELEIKRDRYQKLKNFVWSMFYNMEKITKELDEEFMQRCKSWDED